MTPKEAMEELVNRGIPLNKIGKEIGVSYAMPNRYYNGDVKKINENIAQRIKDKFGIVIDQDFTYKV